MLKSIAFFEPLLRKAKKHHCWRSSKAREEWKSEEFFWFGRGSCSERDGVNEFDLVWMDYSKIWWYNLI